MFDIGLGEFLVLAVLALLVLGPEKLPKFAADTARVLRQVRRMANNAREDVQRELGPDLQGISLEDLNPRTALRKHVLDGVDDEPDGARRRSAGAAAPADDGVPPRYDPDAT
jgi:sec-independent protein translocase protein TatB